MPAYSFEAIDLDGNTRKGIIEADTVRAARANLRHQNLVPLAVTIAQETDTEAAQNSRALFTRKIFNTAALALWSRQLSSLLLAGVPLERALQALVDESEIASQQKLIASLRAEVNAGSSFATALQQYPHEFSSVYIAVVAAGEHSGGLAQVLESLASDLEAQQELRGKLLSASLYPAIVTGISILIVIFLVSYVVPQVATVFANSKQALPFLTRAMMFISATIRNWWWLLALLGLGIGIALRQARKTTTLRQRMDAWWLRLPVVGGLARNYNGARFAGTLGLLIQAGVPIIQAFQAANATFSNQAMQADAQEALVLVQEGAPLANALAQQKRFPSLMLMFIRLGEQTGELPTMLQRTAEQLSAQVQRRALQLATILEPLMIVGMGLMVMLIVLAVLMPIIQLNQLVK